MSKYIHFQKQSAMKIILYVKRSTKYCDLLRVKHASPGVVSERVSESQQWPYKEATLVSEVKSVTFQDCELFPDSLLHLPETITSKVNH